MANTRPLSMSDRDAGARDTVYRKPAAAAAKAAPAAPAKSKGPANAGPVKTAGAPAAKNITGQGRPSVPAPNTYSPKTDAQYNTYSTSGGPQSAQKRTPNMTGQGRPSVPASNGAAPTIFNSNSAMPGEAAMNSLGKKAFNYLNTLKMPGEDAMNKIGSSAPSKKNRNR